MIIFVFQSSVVWICLSLGLVCVCTYLHGACVWGRSTQFAQISGGGQVIITEICIPFVSCVFFSHTHTPTRALWLVFQLRISHSTGIYSEFIKKKKEKYRARLQLCIVANLPLCESPSVRDIIWRTLSSQQLRLSFYSSLSRIGAIGSHSIFIYLFLSPPIGPRIIKRRHPSDGGG